MTKTTATKPVAKTVYVVIDGTRARPAGYVGTYATAAEAKAARFALCRTGGFVRRERV